MGKCDWKVPNTPLCEPQAIKRAVQVGILLYINFRTTLFIWSNPTLYCVSGNGGVLSREDKSKYSDSLKSDDCKGKGIGMDNISE